MQKMPAPEDRKAVEHLLGTVNYLAKFLPNLSSMIGPIRQLLKQDVQFYWEFEQETAFKQIQYTLSQTPVLTYFNVTKPVTIPCDASKSGLGGAVMQDGKPVAYASRSLMKTECQYAQIERELHEVVFSLERFSQYTYGTKVTIESDHTPLESIVNNPLALAPPRLQRMLLRIQKYGLTLVCKPGKDMILADTLSRAYTPDFGSYIWRKISSAMCILLLVISQCQTHAWRKFGMKLRKIKK
ncbi:hypothetical protein HOLleu_38070 [Holothuria leucospilota]|uniref:Reverse transcriptase/retrotransposon-derived protein RNase H-like domain-containing protein n=1 Tax=Holothuria leucospilota TaxID=206669 RepID=A0A9Q1BEZ5_HOLLE|nr:hypothetical protein HOLleu_38070 [Holothuria leucospilota]